MRSITMEFRPYNGRQRKYMRQSRSAIGVMHTQLPALGCANCKLAKLCMPPPISDDERDKLAGLVTHRVRLARGASLYRAGELFENLYLIRLGQLKTVEQDHLGVDIVTAFHMPSAALGWDGIATGRFQMQAVALEDSEICVMPFARLQAMLVELPQMQHHFMRILSQRLVNAGRRALCSSRRFLDARFAAFIVSMSRRHARAGYSPSIFELRMSRLDLCSYLGTSGEALSRLIAKFKRNGWIRVSRREFEVLAPDELARLAGGDHPQGRGQDDLLSQQIPTPPHAMKHALDNALIHATRQ